MTDRQLTIDEALALCSATGWPTRTLVRAVAVMTAESQRHTAALGINAAADSNGTIVNKSVDRGLFQVNSTHLDLDNEDAYDPVANATKANEIRTSQGWTAWSVYVSGKFTAFLDEVQARYDLGEWQLLVPYVGCL